MYHCDIHKLKDVVHVTQEAIAKNHRSSLVFQKFQEKYPWQVGDKKNYNFGILMQD
jgi:hypothetical protein